MIHEFKQGKEGAPTFVLLHGTGGTEHDLMPLAKALDQDASILTFRGDVIEDGMARFFRRLRPGVFDEEDLLIRTEAMIERIDKLSNDLSFDGDNVYAIGYSNGANLAASILFKTSETFKGAMLLHPMVPLKGVKLPNLSSNEILITAGVNDPICPKDESEMLFKMFDEARSNVTVEWFKEGHSIGASEVEALKRWYANKKG